MLKKLANQLDAIKERFTEEDVAALIEALLITTFMTIAIISGLTILTL